VRLLLLAPPGAGKGTQGERLAAWSGGRHIAAGDLLRAEARAGRRLGREIAAYQARGDLVPDQIVLDVLTPAVVEAAAEGGYILDGFPRTLPQATAAAELAARLGVTLHAAIYLHAPEPVLTRRLLDRASQSGRSDDQADVIRHRLQVFAETTGPLVPYYTERGILVAVDADQPPDSVTADIQSRLSGLSLPGGARLLLASAPYRQGTDACRGIGSWLLELSARLMFSFTERAARPNPTEVMAPTACRPPGPPRSTPTCSPG
jgi:adenylate kinase